MTGRGIWIVMDAVGIGGAPDASFYGDVGANTFGNIFKACATGMANVGRQGNLDVPNLASLGIYAAHEEANSNTENLTTIKSIICSRFSGFEYQEGMQGTIFAPA